MQQFLCPPRPRTMGLLAWLLGSCAWSGAALASTDPRDALMSETRAWLLTEMQLKPHQVQLTPLNPKLRVRACDAGWQWKNFLHQSTVQASCAQPQTLFLIRWKIQTDADPTPKAPPVAAVKPAPTKPPVVATRKALAINQTLPRGSHVEPSMLTWIEIPATQWAGHHLSEVSAAQGAELTRDMRPGQLLSRNDLRPSVMVKKGQLVTIHIGISGALSISAQLQALQDGRMGETINLKNPESGRVLSGVVTGLNAVRNP